jgi:hypothetical protein
MVAAANEPLLLTEIYDENQVQLSMLLPLSALVYWRPPHCNPPKPGVRLATSSSGTRREDPLAGEASQRGAAPRAADLPAILIGRKGPVARACKPPGS